MSSISREILNTLKDKKINQILYKNIKEINHVIYNKIETYISLYQKNEVTELIKEYSTSLSLLINNEYFLKEDNNENTINTIIDCLIKNKKQIFNQNIKEPLLNYIIENNQNFKIDSQSLIDLITIVYKKEVPNTFYKKIFKNYKNLNFSDLEIDYLLKKRENKKETLINYLENKNNILLKNENKKLLFKGIIIDEDILELITKDKEDLNHYFPFIDNKKNLIKLIDKKKLFSLKELSNIQNYLKEKKGFFIKFKNFIGLIKKNKKMIETNFYDIIIKKINDIKSNEDILKKLPLIDNIEKNLLLLKNKNDNLINAELNSFYYLILNNLLETILTGDLIKNKETMNLCEKNLEELNNQLEKMLLNTDKSLKTLKEINKQLELKR